MVSMDKLFPVITVIDLVVLLHELTHHRHAFFCTQEAALTCRHL
jgi:hypothetical protein